MWKVKLSTYIWSCGYCLAEFAVLGSGVRVRREELWFSRDHFLRQTSNTKKMNISNWRSSLKPTKPPRNKSEYVRIPLIHNLSLKVTEPNKERELNGISTQWIISLLVLMIKQSWDKTDSVMRLIPDLRWDTHCTAQDTNRQRFVCLFMFYLFIYLHNLSHCTVRFLRWEDGDLEETICGEQTCVLWGQLCWKSWENLQAAQNHPGPCKRVSDVSEPCCLLLFFLGYQYHILWFDLNNLHYWF